MGLQERQHIERIQTDVIPANNKSLHEATGGEMIFDPDWSTFQNSVDACLNLSSFLTKVIGAVQWVARTPVGKQALAEGINRIVVRNISDPAEKAMTLKDKIFQIDLVLSSFADEGRFGDSDLISFLENNL